MKIEERLVRKSSEDVVYLGNLTKDFLNTEMAKLLYAMTNGRIHLLLLSNTDNGVSSDRKVGRMEAYSQIMKDIEQLVSDGREEQESLLKKAEEAEIPEEETAIPSVEYKGTNRII